MNRIGTLATAAALGAFALAGSAAAAYAPKLVVNHGSYVAGARTSLELKISQTEREDDIARATILVPAGYEVSAPPPPGSRVGTLLAAVNVMSRDLANVDLTGVVETADPATFSAEALECTGSATPSAVLLVVLNTARLQAIDPAAPSSFTIPAFLDESAVAGFVRQLVLCPPHPSQAPLGMQLRFLSLELPRFATTPPEDGRHVWEALLMPYMANGNVANPAGTTESRGIVVVPASLRLARAGRASVRPGTFASVIATVVQGSLQARKRVTFLSGTRPNDLRPAGSKLTTATGRASLTRKAPRRGALFFQALYGPTDVSGAGCATPATALAPAGCTSATLSELASPVVRISVRR